MLSSIYISWQLYTKTNVLRMIIIDQWSVCTSKYIKSLSRRYDPVWWIFLSRCDRFWVGLDGFLNCNLAAERYIGRWIRTYSRFWLLSGLFHKPRSDFNEASLELQSRSQLAVQRRTSERTTIVKISLLFRCLVPSIPRSIPLQSFRCYRCCCS